MRDKTILIVGGDKRQQELFKILKEHYKNIFTYGLYEKESLPLKNDIIILPIPVTNDGIYINAPLTTRKISLEEISRYVDSKTKVFGGKMPDKLFFGSDAFIYDYNNNEALTIFNAALTAEAAISLAISNSDNSIFKSKCLVTGFGRIGKFLANYLKALSADVTVAARKESDLTFIESFSLKPLKYKNLKNNIKKFDYIFNTVPELIFNPIILKNCKEKVLIIDLASIPGGVDYDYAEKNSIKVLKARSLPGKFSSESSAKLIYRTIKPYF